MPMRSGDLIYFKIGDSSFTGERQHLLYFDEVCSQPFVDWFEATGFAASARAGLFESDVTFVSTEEINKFRSPITEDDDKFEDGGDHPDLLGVYVAHHHRWSHRPAILVSPEKVMSACLSFSRVVGQGNDAGTEQSSPSLPMMSLYPALLVHVAFHELAHAGMCEAAAVPCPGHRPWQAIAEAFDAGEQQAADAMLESAISFNKDDCKWRQRQRLTRSTAHACHTIEESLANAIALRQDYDPPIASLLRDWVLREPPSYRAGLAWQMDDASLFATATSWTHAKPLLHAMDAHQNADPHAKRKLREFQDFARDLRLSGGVMRHAVDFGAYCG
jgi:hypothetical protein